jgi:hypothetical protein
VSPGRLNKPSQKPRTSQSALAFAQGAFGLNRTVPVAVLSRDKSQDRELRFFDHCARWGAEYRGTTFTADAQAHRDSALPAIASRVAAALGLAEADVTQKVLRLMWEACQYDIVVDSEPGRWCTLFDESDAAALEFGDDLASYNRRVRCLLQSRPD